MNRRHCLRLGLATPVALAAPACTTLPDTDTREPRRAFMREIARLEGRAFAGHITANQPPPDDDPFTGRTLVMHVMSVDPASGEIRIPFHVGDNRSRTWILTPNAAGLRLKHDHRLEDGSDDPVTMYGGDTASPGTPNRQEFPVDQFSRELFQRNDLDVALSNVWAMEIHPRRTFIYELSRPDGRLFRVEFDLSRSGRLELPPPPWGGGDHQPAA